MRIPPKVSSVSTSLILALAALTLLLAPIQMVQAMIFRQGAPFWYPIVIIGTILLRSLISFGLFERKSWAWVLYSLDKILFLSLYGVRFIQAESLPYAQIERRALIVPVILTGGKFILALLAYEQFTPNFKRHILELWNNWRNKPSLDLILKEMKTNKIVRIALLLYFALTLGSQTMGQLYTAILLWANTLQTQFPWLKLSLLIANDNFWVLSIGSIIFFTLAVATSLKNKTWGWKLLLTIFFFAFLVSLPRQLHLSSGKLPQNFWIRRTETLLSFLWLGGAAFWLSDPSKAQGSSWQKKKQRV